MSKTDLHRPPPGEPLAGEYQLHPMVHAELGQADHGDHCRDDADAYLAEAELNVFRGHHDIGRADETEPPGKRRAVNGGDHGLGAVQYGGENVRVGDCTTPVDGLAGRFLQIRSGAESRPGPGDDNRPDGRIVIGAPKVIVELVHQGG